MELQKNITWEKIGPIGILSIDNPPENYLENPEFIQIGLLKKISEDDTLKGMIIKGTGRHFSAGADMKKLKQLSLDEKLLFEKISDGKKLIDFIDNLYIPVVAVVNSVCFGGGLEIALACHFRICNENVLFAFPESNHDIMPGLGGTVRLVRLVGLGKSAEIILTGEPVDSQKALEMGLADYILPAKELQHFAIDFLTRITNDRNIEVIRSIMKSINNSQNLPFEKALEEETKLFCSLAVKNLQDNH